MLSRIRRTNLGWVVAALFALAMTMSGFAHKPIANAHPLDLAAYALPDGSLPALCAQDDGAPADHSHITPHCDACALSSAPGLAPAQQTCVYVPLMRTVAYATQDGGQFSPAARHAPTSRGPPLS